MAQETSAVQHNYNSNPFKAAAIGLGKALSVNPVATLLLAVLPMIMGLAAYILFIIFATTLNDSLGLLVLASIVVGVVILVIVIRAMLGAMYVLKASREQAVTSASSAMSKHVSPFVLRFFGIIFVHFLLFVVTGIATSLIGSALDDPSAVVIVMAVLMLAAGFVAVRWSLAPFVLVNENTGVQASLKKSFAMTKGHFVEMLGVIIAQSMISGNGLLSVVGSVSGLDARYHEIKAYRAANATKPSVHWMNWFLIALVGLAIGFYVWVFSMAADSTNDLFNLDSSSSSSSTTYCYFDDSFDYNCADSESECKAIADCKAMLDSRESLDSLFDSYNVD